MKTIIYNPKVNNLYLNEKYLCFFKGQVIKLFKIKTKKVFRTVLNKVKKIKNKKVYTQILNI